MEKKANSRFNFKGNDVKFKDDDYETPKKVLQDIIPFISKDKIIYDPFYCDGYVKTEWKDLGYECLNNKVDAYIPVKFDFDIIITNPPFSMKKKVIDLCLSYNKPFMILLPIDTLGSKWIKPYFNKFQYLIPNGRYNFYKKNKDNKGAWFDTMWLCYNINLDNTIIKL
tara:strand:- start:61 stop:564 length:504 start_codon:yes stop_codon:yes gene_type:complete